MLPTRLSAVALAVSLAISCANGLTCYLCDTTTNPACNFGAMSFTYEKTECGLIKNCGIVIARDFNGNELVLRGCAHPGFLCKLEARIIKFLGNNAGTLSDVKCYTCNTPECNSAQKVKIGGVMFVIGLILVYLF